MARRTKASPRRVKRAPAKRAGRSAKRAPLNLKRLFAFFVLSLVIVAGWGTYRFFASGTATNIKNTVVAKIERGIDFSLDFAGFTLKNVVIDGRIRTTSKELSRTLQVSKGKTIYQIDLAGAAKRVQNLPWVHSVRLERRLPDTLFVKIVEREPVGFYQQNKKLYLVDSYGDRIGRFPLKDFPGYVVATGKGAAQALPNLIQRLGRHQALYAKTTGAVYMGQRRWDIILNNDLRVKLPEADIQDALERLAEFVADQKLETAEISEVDLRTKGKVYFYVSKDTGKKRKRSNRGKHA